MYTNFLCQQIKYSLFFTKYKNCIFLIISIFLTRLEDSYLFGFVVFLPSRCHSFYILIKSILFYHYEFQNSLFLKTLNCLNNLTLSN